MIRQIQNEDQRDSEESNQSRQQQKNMLEVQFQKIFTKHPDKHPNFNFYMEYCRLYFSNIALTDQINKIIQQKQILQKQILNAAKSQNQVKDVNSQSNSQKKKRCRRTAGEIARHYQCKFDKCQKSYGSEGSLNQHIKLKHSKQQKRE